MLKSFYLILSLFAALDEILIRIRKDAMHRHVLLLSFFNYTPALLRKRAREKDGQADRQLGRQIVRHTLQEDRERDRQKEAERKINIVYNLWEHCPYAAL